MNFDASFVCYNTCTCIGLSLKLKQVRRRKIEKTILLCAFSLTIKFLQCYKNSKDILNSSRGKELFSSSPPPPKPYSFYGWHNKGILICYNDAIFILNPSNLEKLVLSSWLTRVGSWVTFRNMNSSKRPFVSPQLIFRLCLDCQGFRWFISTKRASEQMGKSRTIFLWK